MRLRLVALDLQVSFGITSSVGDGKHGAFTHQGCFCVLDVDHLWMHKTESHRVER